MTYVYVNVFPSLHSAFGFHWKTNKKFKWNKVWTTRTNNNCMWVSALFFLWLEFVCNSNGCGNVFVIVPPRITWHSHPPRRLISTPASIQLTAYMHMTCHGKWKIFTEFLCIHNHRHPGWLSWFMFQNSPVCSSQFCEATEYNTIEQNQTKESCSEFWPWFSSATVADVAWLYDKSLPGVEHLNVDGVNGAVSWNRKENYASFEYVPHEYKNKNFNGNSYRNSRMKSEHCVSTSYEHTHTSSPSFQPFVSVKLAS